MYKILCLYSDIVRSHVLVAGHGQDPPGHGRESDRHWVICTCMWWGHINRYVSWVVFDDLVELLYSPNDHARPDDQCVVICIVLPSGCV